MIPTSELAYMHTKGLAKVFHLTAYMHTKGPIEVFPPYYYFPLGIMK